MTRTLISFLALLFLTVSAFAQSTGDSTEMLVEQLKKIDSLEKSFHYKRGKIELAGGVATVNIPTGFKFLESAEAKYVLEDLWGNPPSAEPTLGLIFPDNSSATSPSYVFEVRFEKIGYVKDNDADKIDYDDLLKDMKEGSVKDNEQRKKMGLVGMDLVGWAAKPYYDKERKILHWAKEYSVEGESENTLNYDIRVLGRKGILSLQAISDMSELDTVNNHIDDVLAMVNFNEGNRYADFDSKTDEVAAWTIGGLVAGKILAKVGFFAVILKFLKFIILGAVVVGGAIWRFITGRRKKKEEELAYQPQPVKDNNEPGSSQA